MKNIPRILPLVGVAAVGVLALNALSGAKTFSDMTSGARAFAEEAAAKVAPKDDKNAAAETEKPAEKAAAKPAPVAACGPSAAALAKEAGLSPAELNILQSLRARSGQLDAREQDMDVQLKLLAAAEAKLDAKINTLNALKYKMEDVVGQGDNKTNAEVDRMVTVFSSMKAKDAAARLAVLDDSVRLPIAAKMKERALSMVLAAMPPAEAKKLTESLAKRYADNEAMKKGRAALAPGGDQAAVDAAAAEEAAKTAPAKAPARQPQRRPAKG
ncbi:MotE family protein [Caulobacter sp. NIBR2454]|uniref:MotE family protein n=1 Tax=Caulobacter sp. NIBR2454 TaxID=3015996 RepID=UPI0022B61114|nr:hypothetical protein [Caulobacter sp. NIBR2454]